ncbi:MAG: response regulator [Pseudomonadota bacterium]
MFVGNNTAFMENLSEKIKGSGGLKVFISNSAKEAVSTAIKKKIDVVVLNMKELQMSGIQTLSHIKKARPLTEVIMLTSPSIIHLSIEGMKLGAFNDLLLPPDIDDLKRMIIEAGIRKKEKEAEEKTKKKRSIINTLDNIAVSATYAEAGQFETAIEILKKEK